MDKEGTVWQRLTRETELLSQPLPGVPIVELAGYQRVLIENHGGVRGYSRERISVSVTYGTVTVCGENLQLRRMSRRQLVICGSIRSVLLERGD